MLRKLYIYIVLAFVAMTTANAQVMVEAKIDSTEIVVGEQTLLHVTANVKKGQTVVFSKLQPMQMLSPGVEVVEAPTTDTVDAGDGYVKVTQHILLTSFEDSLHYIPAQKVKVNGKVYESKSLALKVLTVPVDTLKPEQFYGPADVQDNPFSWEEWEYVIWMSILTMALSIIAILAWLRLKSGKPIKLKVKIVKRVPPHQRALNSIDAIKQQTHQMDEKTYYTQLTDALRNYIQERFQFNAMEMTSTEIIARLKQENDEEKIKELKMLFETADLVKFAKYQVDISSNDRNLVSAIEFINETKQDNVPLEERIEPTVTTVERQTMRMRKILKWIVALTALLSVGMLAYVGWLIYDLRM